MRAYGTGSYMLGAQYPVLLPNHWLKACCFAALMHTTHTQLGSGVLTLAALQAVGGCASGSVTVLVTDLCEGCGAEFVYVSGPAFRSVVTDSVGQVAGRFRQVGFQGAVQQVPGLHSKGHCIELVGPVQWHSTGSSARSIAGKRAGIGSQ